jgi:hypothetical protein
MERTSSNKSLIIFGFLGWIIWGVIVGVILGLKMSEMINEDVSFILMSIVPPITYLIISPFYFKRYNYPAPLKIALAFIAILIVLDAFIVGLIVEGDFELFTIASTWIAYVLGFVIIYLIGFLKEKKLKESDLTLSEKNSNNSSKSDK